MKLLAALTIGALLGLASTAAANEQARALYQAGSEAYQAGNYLVAIEAFEAARALEARPAIVFSLAQAYRIQYWRDKDLKHLEGAIEAYNTYLDLVPEGGRRSHAAQHLSDLVPVLERERLPADAAAREKAAQAPRIIVTSLVEGAQARIDDGAPRVVPATFEVAAGPHTVTIEAPEHRAVAQQTVAVAGTAVALSLNPTPEPAKVTVRAPSGARVAVDDRTLGISPLAEPLELAPGRHVLVVTDRGRRPFAQTVQVDRGEAVSVAVELEPTGQRTLAWSMLWSSAALVLGAGVTGYLALAAEADAVALEDRLGDEGLSGADYDRYRGLQSDRDQWRDVTIGLGVGAVAVATTGLMLWIFDNPSAPSGLQPAPPGAPAAAVWRW